MQIAALWIREKHLPVDWNGAAPSTSLDHIHVASPCPASWDAMSGDDRARRCQKCKLNVYNLSEMTRAEAEELIASREGRLCVRFYRRGDGTIITKDCPRGVRAITRRVSRFAGTVLSTIICATPVFSQAPAGSTSQNSIERDKQAQLRLDVTVVDPTGAVIQSAKVVLCQCKDKITNMRTTDAAGTAHFTGLAKGTYEISIEAPGFKRTERSITVKKAEELQVRLLIAPQTTTVEVKAGPVAVMGTIGILTVSHPSDFPVVTPSTGRPSPLR